MSLYYSQTLIAKSKDFVPTGEQVEKFISEMAAMEVVPGDRTTLIRTPTGKTRTYSSPLIGRTFVQEIKHLNKLSDLTQIAKTVQPHPDYEIEMSGSGFPKLAPLRMEFSGPYGVNVTCTVSSILRSTSDLHEESWGNQKATLHGKPCQEFEHLGLFTNPHNMETIQVPGAGCARFWVRFGLGKFLFPAFDRPDLQLLNPTIIDVANEVFAKEFVQGCHWG